MKPVAPIEVSRRESPNGDFLSIRLAPGKDVPPEILAQLGPGEHAVEAFVTLRDDLSVKFQSQLIDAARDILNQMEASLRGGVGAKPGQKPVKA